MSTSPSVRRVLDVLTARGLGDRVVELAESTRTAEMAAAALGCRVEQIVKSLVFRGVETDRPVLVVASGGNRVDEARVAALIGEPVAKANAAFVKARTGFAIGGVPPFAHSEPPTVLVDEDLLLYDELWAAAGSPFTVFRVGPAELLTLTGGTLASVAEERT
jgi:prolyl-tRNA editing enzyme YbaK/EbsC (Cys-tRNA(Pro) deacylase)